MVTVREIAKRAGVSLGTVDRVLHDRGRVSPETAARVRAAVEELGFTPNFFARNLSASRSYRIGVLMPGPDQDEGYWRASLSGIERAAEGLRGYGFSLRPAFFDRYDPSSFQVAFSGLASGGVDGILMAPVIESAALSALESLGPKAPPVVCFDTGVAHPAVNCRIGQDSFRSGQLAARLLALSLRKEGPVAAIAPSTDNRHIARRVEGFSSALAARGTEHSCARRPARTDPGAMAEVLEGLFRESPGLAGILVADSTANLAARALAALGKKEVALIGYDLLEEDLPYLESGAIDFLIAQDPAGQGELGVRALFDLVVHGAAPAAELFLPLSIVARENYADYL